MEEAADRPHVGLGDGERRAGRVEVVHRHRETALGLVAAPCLRHLVELRATSAIDVVRGDDAEAVAGLLQTRHRLPHLADRPPFERELARNEHCLVADRNRAHAEALVARKVLSERADDREPPAVRVREALELVQKAFELALLPHRVAADQRRAGDDAIGEERAPLGEKW